MPDRRKTIVLPAAFLLATALPGIAVAQSTGLEDMVGARAGQAEGALQSRGYLNTGGEKGDDRSYTYWWNADRRQCVSIATMNGRYASITPTLPPDCKQSASAPPQPGNGYRPPATTLPSYPVRPTPLPDYRGPIVGGRPIDLGLVCFGDGSRDGITTGTTWTWNRDRDRYDYGTSNQLTREQFDASLTLQLWYGGGRIRLPKSLVPPINSRGNDGWWDLENVSIGPDTITASYRLNGMNKPKLTIDRRSGRITVRGFASYGFRGRCDEIGHQQRRF